MAPGDDLWAMAAIRRRFTTRRMTRDADSLSGFITGCARSVTAHSAIDCLNLDLDFDATRRLVESIERQLDLRKSHILIAAETHWGRYHDRQDSQVTAGTAAGDLFGI